VKNIYAGVKMFKVMAFLYLVRLNGP